ncbi:hypothetical protein DMENIID0001_000670 [Sergentomyia squamirostris]
MKGFVVVFCVAFISFCSARYASDETLDVIIFPCARESSISRDDYNDAKSYHSVPDDRKDDFGCFTDCIARNMGWMDDNDGFQVQSFQDKLANFMPKDLADRVVTECEHRIQHNRRCHVTGDFFKCVIETAKNRRQNPYY